MPARRPRAALVAGLLTLTAAGGLLTAAPAGAVVGTATKDGSYPFTAKLDIGGQRSCSAALVDAQWLVTAASCFAENPAQSLEVPAGAPKTKTTATVGRTDMSRETGGTVTTVEQLVPRADRDLVMAKLAKPVPGITPAEITAKAPLPGEDAFVSGYGRTKDEWVPDRLHYGRFSVSAAKATTVGIKGQDNGAAVCEGDTGAPVWRDIGGRYELIGVSSRSWQGGCLGHEEEKRTDAVASRTDDIAGWIQQVRARPQRSMTAAGDFDGDGKTDLALLTDYGRSKDGRSQAALWVYTAKGDGFAEPRTVWDSGSDSWNWESSKLAAGDFNGDGKTDLAVLYNYGRSADGRNQSALWTFTSGGSAGFAAPRKVWESGKDSWSWESSKLAAGDFNGDGKTDLAVLYNYGRSADGRNQTGLMTLTSNGDGFESPRKVWESGKDSWNWESSKLAAGDFNGDGKTDLAILYGYGQSADGRNQSALWFTANDSNGFSAPRKVWESGAKESWSWESSKLAAGDFNGDGKTDLAVLYNYGRSADGRNQTGLWVFDGSKDGLSAPRKVWNSGAQESWNWQASELAAGDFNGDGKSDISVTYDYGRGADGRIETGLWIFTSKGNGFESPRKVWNSGL
ncbi:FG-GAP-like repeat-containing protein [Streptomyces sp. CB02923]|uniref:FG-GAP-like repeat-containing protein n=1 Tax=Streptomyces sp. CB02923 TaxID=1718985 RepID=UPI00093E8A35|nr:FG-GAP-like repeat-containing protein [Streptomyces sp. CB02923]